MLLQTVGAQFSVFGDQFGGFENLCFGNFFPNSMLNLTHGNCSNEKLVSGSALNQLSWFWSL